MDRRIYVSLFLAIMATALGASLVLPLLPVYAQSMGATGLQLGMIFSGFALARSFALPVVGRFADTLGRRKLLLWGLASYALISLGFLAATSPLQLILCRILQGVGASMTIPVARTLVGELSPVGQEGKVMGHFNMAFFAGLAMGPWLGGFLKDFAGIEYPFYSMGILALLSFCLIYLTLPREMHSSEIGLVRPQTSYLKLLRLPEVAAIFLFRFGIIIGMGMNWTFMPLFGHNLLGLSGSEIGILISLNVVMTTVLQPIFGRMADKYSRPKLTALGGLLASFGLLGVPFCDSFWSLFGVNLLMGVASGIYMPPLMAMSVDLGRRTGFMTRMMSLLEMSFSVGMVVGPLMAGLIAEAFGLRSIFWIGGGVGLAFTIIFLVLIKRTRRAEPVDPASGRSA